MDDRNHKRNKATLCHLSQGLSSSSRQDPHPPRYACYPLQQCAGLSGESVKDRLFEDLPPKRGSDDAPFTLSPRWPGERVGLGGADEPVCGAAHLTLPTLRLGPSLSPLKGGEGLVSAGIILVEHDASHAIEFSSP